MSDDRNKQIETATEKPTAPAPLFDNIPEELKSLNTWVVWDYVQKDGKWSKVPFRSYGTGTVWAKSTDPKTWSSFEKSKERLALGKKHLNRTGVEEKHAGIGFVFDGQCGISGIDVDSCIDEQGELSRIAVEILERFNSYAEISPSGTGIKIWIKGDFRPLLPRGTSGTKRGDFEVYTYGRYFTVTGNVVGEYRTIAQADPKDLKWFLDTFVFPKPAKTTPAAISANRSVDTGDADDAQIWQAIQRSKNAEKINALMNGDISAYGEDDSRADMALASHLAFWYGPNPARVEAAFNRSALAERDKWKSREDYRQETIAKAIGLCTKFYTPRRTSSNTTTGNAGSKPPKEKGGPPSDIQIVEAKNSSHRLAELYLDQYGKFNDAQRIFYWNEDIYRWDTTLNYYYAVHAAAFKAEMNKFIHRIFCRDAQEKADEGKTEEDGTVKVANVSAQLVSNVIGAIHGLTRLDPIRVPVQPHWLGHPDEKRSWLSVSNGLLDLDAIKQGKTSEALHPPSPYWFSPSCLPVEYKPDAQCPRWLKFLDQTFESDPQVIRMLQQWFGYCLTLDTKYQKFLMMQSEGGHGKGVIAAALEAVIGNRNMSFVPLENFAATFALGTTLGKQVNLVADSNEIAKVAEGNLKSFVVGDPMYFDRKNKDPLNCRPTAKLMVSTNRLPFFGDRSQGVWRRLLLLPLNATLQVKDQIAGMDKPEWWSSREEEVPGILNWSIQGLQDLNFEGTFLIPDKVAAAVERYKLECNHVATFLTDHCRLEEGAWVECETLYLDYKTWADKNRHKIDNAAKFGKEVFRLFPSVVKGRPGARNNRITVYEGLKYES